MRRALALMAALPLLGACESELNHLLSYDDVRPDHAQAAAPPAAPPAAPDAAAAQPAALSPAEPPNAAFCRGVAESDARASDFDSTTRRAVHDRSLAQCLALHGD